ncbi:apolipoprotein D-like [Palaemon carinicauda]|uniref:apolipoprotein D-like n=1 Tax=Palaemon carinicauda TaxID=392227 RepID=UPI0035B590E4
MLVNSFLGSLTMVGTFITQAFDGLILFPSLLRVGPCPTVPVIKNFNTTAYLGRWYELERFENLFQSGACATADYSLFPNGSIEVVNTQISNGNLDSLTGIAKPGPDPTVGDLIVSFPGPLSLLTQTPNYRIVTTDYTTRSVVYSCASFAGKRIEFAWILGREPYIPKAELDVLKTELESYGIDTSRFMQMRQLNCPRRQLTKRRNLFP